MTLLLLLLAGCSADEAQAPVGLWSQVVPGSTSHHVEARWVLEAGRCDDWSVGPPGSPSVPGFQRQRSQGPLPNFDILVCAAVLDDSWNLVELVGPGGVSGAVRGWDHVRSTVAAAGGPIVFVGDTGCRDNAKQDCDPQSEWPFPAVLERIAAASPSMILHVGDYRYRPSPGKADSWRSWREEFIGPISAHSDIGPWVLARGNHERCASDAHGEGWWLLLGPPGQNECPPHTLQDPWQLDVVRGTATHRFIVLDTSSHTSSELAGRFGTALADSSGANYTRWVQHHPILGMFSYSPDKPEDRSARDRLAQAIADTEVGPLCTAGRCTPQAIVTGHVHVYEQARLHDEEGTPVWPEQIVAGNGGIHTYEQGFSSPCSATLEVQQDHTSRTWQAELTASAGYGFVAATLRGDSSTESGWDTTLKVAVERSFDSLAPCRGLHPSVTVPPRASLGFPVGAGGR